MKEAFLTFSSEHQLFKKGDRILLAVSGGADSVVMARLMAQTGAIVGIAHCNFRLRGEESDGDEHFVQQLAAELNAPFYIKCFDTAQHAQEEKVSIQMAARELRYEWLEEIRIRDQYDAIAVGSHRSDEAETILINLVRGTGLAGLHGILPKRNKVIRPLLFASSEQVRDYASQNNWSWREDSSNASTYYMRNKLRHEVIPLLKHLNPDLESTFSRNAKRFHEAEVIIRSAIEDARERIVKEKKDGIYISIKGLRELKPIATYLFELLRPYNFSESIVQQIVSALGSQPGKSFHSSNYELILDREDLIITPRKNKTDLGPIITINEEIQVLSDSISLRFELKEATATIQKESSKAYLDYNKLSFPLELRCWQEGDRFQPLGMKGKKKLSDFFIDEKVPLHRKRNMWILTSNKEIVWVVGMRIDDRFKVVDTTKKIYLVSLI